MIDLGEVGDWFPDEEKEKPESPHYNPRYQKGLKELYEEPVIWVDGENEMVINEALSQSINTLTIPSVLWVGDDFMDMMSKMYVRGVKIRGRWTDPRSQYPITRVTFSWVEDNRLAEFDEDKQYGGIKLEIDRNDGPTSIWVWMVDHNEPDVYNRELNCWKAKWRD